MNFLLIIPYYIRWHYSQAFLDILQIWRNFFSFIYNFFSIKNLTLNLFSPWQRIEESYSKQFSFEGTVGSFVVNTLMRIVGAMIRLIFIITGIIALIFCLLFGIAVIFVWIFYPLFIFYFLSKGISLIVLT